METVAAKKNYSSEEYLFMEDRSVEKHEFYNGKIIKMPGAKPLHNLIATNISTQLNNELETKPGNFFVLNSDTKIHIPRLNSFVYPDAVVLCEAIELYPGSETVITNPLLIVEVLSPSTEGFDRRDKFFYYKRIPSFKEYLLVEQEMPMITSSYKIADNTWKDTIAEGTDSSVYLQSIDCTIALSKIYKGVVFPA